MEHPNYEIKYTYYHPEGYKVEVNGETIMECVDPESMRLDTIGELIGYFEEGKDIQ